MMAAGMRTVSNRMCNLFHRTWILVFLLHLNMGSSQSVDGLVVTLSPLNVYVDSSADAVFTCSYECSADTRYSMWWVVGDHSVYRNRLFRLGRVNPFIASSNIQVELVDQTSCSSNSNTEGRVQQQLTIHGSSAGLLNRTAVQCRALPDADTYNDAYSQYGLVLLNPPAEPSLSPTPTPTPSLTPSSPTPSPAPSTSATLTEVGACPTPEVVTVVEKVTVTETIILPTVLPTVLPTSLPPDLADAIETLQHNNDMAHSLSHLLLLCTVLICWHLL